MQLLKHWRFITIVEKIVRNQMFSVFASLFWSPSIGSLAAKRSISFSSLYLFLSELWFWHSKQHTVLIRAFSLRTTVLQSTAGNNTDHRNKTIKLCAVKPKQGTAALFKCLTELKGNARLSAVHTHSFSPVGYIVNTKTPTPVRK